MSDSLNLAGRWELMDQGLVPQQPVMLNTGYDLGSPVPVTATLVGDLLDGDRISGRRTGNRTVSLPLMLTAPDRQTLSLYTDQVMQAVDAATFTLTWWPDQGMPLAWDCYRATTTIGWDQRWESGDGQTGYQRTLTVTFSAFPFGRSTDRQIVSAAATPTVIDSWDTAPGGATLDTSRFHDGTGSARVNATWVVSQWGNYYHAPSPVTRTWAGALRKDVSTSNSLTFWAYIDSASTSEDFEWTLTLTSAGGSATMVVTYTNMPTQSWRQVSFPLKRLTSKTGTWDPTLVTGYSLTFRDYRQYWATPAGGSTHSSTLRVNVDTMQINPSSSFGTQTTDGALLTIPGVIGSAKTPVALALTNSASMNGCLVHRPPSDADPAADILNALATSTDQTITIPNSAAGYNGTYTVVLAMSAASASSHQATVTFNQRATGSNTVVATQQLQVNFTPGSPFPYLVVGQVTLPMRALPLDGSQTTTSYTVRVQLNSGDAATDLLLLDTRGPTCIAVLSPGAHSVFIDEPDPRYGLGLVLAAAASTGDRSGCYGIMDNVKLSGGPFSFMPGDNTILVHSPGGSPALTAAYAPRWMGERSGGDVVTT